MGNERTIIMIAAASPKDGGVEAIKKAMHEHRLFHGVMR
ncbi:hypothetical protein MPQ_0631 [Methylovorus sp. MP688]|nr:hypothetical protein MPQ_0631 [Methylovorus sp. MP688]